MGYPRGPKKKVPITATSMTKASACVYDICGLSASVAIELLYATCTIHAPISKRISVTRKASKNIPKEDAIYSTSKKINLCYL